MKKGATLFVGDPAVVKKRLLRLGAKAVMLAALVGSTPDRAFSQVSWSVAPTVWVDTDFGLDGEVGPGVTLGIERSADQAFGLSLDIAYARTDFPVALDELHRHHGAAVLSFRMMLGGAASPLGVTYGVGALFWDDINETDPAFRSSANAEEIFVPGVLVRFPVSDTWGIEAFAQDMMSGWFNAVLDSSEGNLQHRVVLGVGLFFR